MARTCLAAGAMALALSGCAAIPGAGVTSAGDIATDAAALNDAYGRAVSGQILLNALRARDQWPRQYVNLTGITNQPTLSYSVGLTLSPLPLNNAADPFRASSAGPLSREQASAYSYTVSPLDSEDINRVVLSPIQRNVFARYWNETNWPDDVLLLVMVRSLRRAAATESDAVSAAIRRLEGDAEDPSDWGTWLDNRFSSGGGACTLESQVEDCAFFRAVHELVEAQHRTDWSVRLRDDDPICVYSGAVEVSASNGPALQGLAATAQQSGGEIELELVAREAATSATSGSAPVRLKHCEDDEPTILEVRDGSRLEATYHVKLRSIDDMVFAMGALLHEQEQANTTFNLARSPCARGSREFCANAPLFAAISSGDPRMYAARVDYQGRRYVAGPAGDRDRTATVITLLSQLFTLAADPGEAPPAPLRVNTN